MADPKQQAELNKLLKEGIDLAKKLGDTAAEASFKNFKGDLVTAQLVVKALRNEWKEYTSDVEGTRLAFSRIVDEISNMGEGAKLAKSSFSGLANIASKLQSHQEGINNLSRKEIKDLKDKVKEKTNNLSIAKKLTEDTIAELKTKVEKDKASKSEIRKYREAKAALGNINSELNKSNNFTEKLTKQLTEAEKEAARVERRLGLTGVLLKGISKIPILGDLLKTEEALTKAQEEARKKGSTGFSVLGAAIKSMGNNFVESLQDPLVTVGLLAKGFQTFVELGFKADTQVTNLSKSMAVSKEQATAIRNRFVEIQNSGQSLFETTENLVNAQLELANAFGATQGFTEQQVRDQVYLTKQIGLSADEAAGLQQLAMANGKTAKEVNSSVIKQTASLARQTGIQLDNKKILGEVAKVSGQIRLQYQNNPELIAKAVVQTQKLGITLEQAAKQARHLLNFEESISDQISAELLTGKDLNLERARLLALNGDIAGASAEILSQVGSASEFSAMNIIQQEALAKAVGMTADELANSLVQQENLNRLGSETKKQIQAQVEELRKKGKVEEANQLMASIGNDTQAKDALDRIAAQEKFNAAMDKLKSMIASIVEGPAMNFVNAIVRLVSDTDKLKGILRAIKAITITIAAAWAVLNPYAAVAGLAAAAVVYSQLEDGEVNSQGLIVGKYNKGTIQPIAQGAPDDNVIFTTNKPQQAAQPAAANVNIDNLIREQQRTNDLLSKINAKESNNYFDTYKVGIAESINTYRV